MPTEITDPDRIAELEAGRVEITDPERIARLDSDAQFADFGDRPWYSRAFEGVRTSVEDTTQSLDKFLAGSADVDSPYSGVPPLPGPEEIAARERAVSRDPVATGGRIATDVAQIAGPGGVVAAGVRAGTRRALPKTLAARTGAAAPLIGDVAGSTLVGGLQGGGEGAVEGGIGSTIGSAIGGTASRVMRGLPRTREAQQVLRSKGAPILMTPGQAADLETFTGRGIRGAEELLGMVPGARGATQKLRTAGNPLDADPVSPVLGQMGVGKSGQNVGNLALVASAFLHPGTLLTPLAARTAATEPVRKLLTGSAEPAAEYFEKLLRSVGISMGRVGGAGASEL